MPHAPRLLVMLLLATLALDVALSAVLQETGNSPVWIALRIVIGQGLLLLLLQGARKKERFVQTSIALTLVALVFSAASAPLIIAIWPIPEDPQQLTGLQAAMMLLLMPIMLWLLGVRAWILRGALEYRWLSAFVISLALLVAEASLTLALMKMISAPSP